MTGNPGIYAKNRISKLLRFDVYRSAAEEIMGVNVVPTTPTPSEPEIKKISPSKPKSTKPKSVRKKKRK